MRPFFIALTLSLLSTSVFGQWNIKHINLDDFRSIKKIKFYNDTIGYAMGTQGLILRTEDAGESWENIETTIEGSISDFAFSPSGELLLTTLNGSGSYRSSNGLSFLEMPTPENDVTNITYSTGDVLYLSGADRVYQSINDGLNWELIYDLGDDGYQWGNIIDFSFLNEESNYAVGSGLLESGNFYSFILKSTDDGETWELLGQYAHDDLGFFTDVHFVDELTGYIISSGRILKTVDGGQNWEFNSTMESAVDLDCPTSEKIITVNHPDYYNGDAISTSFQINTSDNSGIDWGIGEWMNGGHLESVEFLSELVGFVAGDYSIIMKTETGDGEIDSEYPWYFFTSTTKKELQSIEVFPNPTSKKIIVKNNSELPSQYSIRSINGILVKQGTTSINEVDVSSLSPGVYFLTMTDKNSWFTSRFVKIDN